MNQKAILNIWRMSFLITTFAFLKIYQYEAIMDISGRQLGSIVNIDFDA